MLEPNLSSLTASAAGEKPAADPSLPVADEAVLLLQLAAQLHLARGNREAWRQALLACRDWFGCAGILGQVADSPHLGPDELEALAGRLTHCAAHGNHCSDVERIKNGRCTALAPHLHIAAAAAREALQASVFDHLAPTWIVDRGGRVLDANAAATALSRSGERFRVIDGRFTVVAPDGAALWRRALAEGKEETRISWLDGDAGEASLRMKALADSDGIAVTLRLESPGAAELAPVFAARLHLTARQSELAAHLLAGLTLVDTARAMGISRHTANEHLAAILRRTGAADRKGLLVLLRQVAQR